jgi:hypothetical protein
MGYTAYNILKTPSIWNSTVPDGDPNHFGTTYLARAKTYVSMLEFSLSNSFTPYFIDPNTLLIKRPSTALGYQAGFHNVNAWNVMMMLINAYQRLAQCHVILADNPSLVTMYTSIAKNTTDLFAQNGSPYAAPDGTTVFNWGYCNFGDCTGRATGEDVGHGQYDMWGLTRAYTAGYTDATASKMKTYADTVVHKIADGPDLYFTRVDGSGGTTQNYLLPGWFFLTPYNTDIYRPIATAAIDSGRQQGSTIMTSGILWMKHWIFVHSQPPDFTLAAGPPSQTVTATSSTSYTVSVNSLNGFAGAVSLKVSGLPGGATATFSPASINGSASSTLTISTGCSTAAGNYSLTITGTSGNLNHSASVALVVNPAASDFTIGASPSSTTVTAGGRTSYAVNVGAVGCFVGTVNLSVTGVPSGATASFNPTAISGSGSSTLSVATGTAASNTYTLTITGTAGSLSHSATVKLTVNPAVTCTTVTANGSWHDTPIGVTETGTFTASFDATPSIAPLSAGVGISHGVQTTYSGFANIVVFSTAGTIQAYNGSAAGYQGTVPYSVAGQPYHFRVTVNIPSHTYSVFVTPPGGTEQTVGSNFAFRSTQSTVTSLDTWGALVNAAPGGTLKVCSFAVQ